MKMSKNIVLLSVTIVVLIGLVAITTYSYFTASTSLTNKISTDIKFPLRPTFTVSGGGELSLTVDRNLTLKENAYIGTWMEGKNYRRVGIELKVALTGESGTTCTYNIYYKDISSNTGYVYTQTGGNSDIYSYLDRNGNASIDSFRYALISQTSAGVAKTTALFGGSTTPFNQTKPVITIPSGSTTITDTWKFSLQFVNHNWDQSALAGKTFKGELYIADVVCT